MVYTVQMKNLKIIVTLVVLTFLTALLAAGWYWLESSKLEQENNAPISAPIPKETIAKSETQPKSAPVLQDELATPSTALTNFEWNIGTRQTYRYQLKTDLKVDIAATLKQDKNEPTQWQQIQTQLSGILNVRVFAKNHDRVQVGVQLSQVDYQLNQQKFELLTALLQTFFIVEMSPEGKPLYYHFPRYIDHSNQVFLKELIDNIQFSLSANPIDPNWTTQETHGSGNYEAKYQREAENKFKKQKVKYTYVTFQQPTEKTEQLPIKLTGDVKHSESTAQLMKQVNWLYLLDGKEEAEFNTVSGTLARNMAQVHLGFSRDEQDPNLGIWRAPDDFDAVIQQFATAQGDVSLSENVIKQLERDKLRQQYANVSVSQLIDAMKNGSSKDSQSWQALRDYLSVYPQVALEIPNLLETADRDLANKIISVLEIVATPEAQQALSTIATHPSQEEAPQQRAVQAIIAFNFIEQPQPQVFETLKKLANSADNERSDTALLAMGSVLEHAGGSLGSLEVRDEINRRLENSTPEQQPTLLRAIGNSRDSSFLPKVTPYFAAPSVDVRAAATEAVRKFQDAESLGYLLNALTQDADRQVRLSALDSLKQREDKSQALPKVKEQLLQETDPELKAKLIQFLGVQKTNDPQIVDVLKQSLQQETDRDMKKHLYNEIYR